MNSKNFIPIKCDECDFSYRIEEGVVALRVVLNRPEKELTQQLPLGVSGELIRMLSDGEVERFQEFCRMYCQVLFALLLIFQNIVDFSGDAEPQYLKEVVGNTHSRLADILEMQARIITMIRSGSYVDHNESAQDSSWFLELPERPGYMGTPPTPPELEALDRLYRNRPDFDFEQAEGA